VSDYRPITDCWLLARPKVAYYGAYPSGFLSRARELLGVGPKDYLLHACSGKVRDYPFRGLGQNDFTMDLDPALKPDFCQDVRDPWPLPPMPGLWDAALSDPPYSPEDATHYRVGLSAFPEPGAMLRRAWEVLRPGGRVGMLHYVFPRPPKDARLVAVIHVLVGYGNRSRVYSVFEKPWEVKPKVSLPVEIVHVGGLEC
jgi:hypothetical protein